MTIKDVEKLTGLTAKAIRYYEEQGLISVDRDKMNLYRNYTEKDVNIFRKIKLFRYLDFSIEEIKDILKMDNEEISEKLIGKAEVYEEKIEKNINKKQFCLNLSKDYKKGEFQIEDYEELIQFEENEEIKENLKSIATPSIYEMIFQVFVFICPIMNLFLTIELEQWYKLKVNSIVAIISTVILTVICKRYVYYYKNRKNIVREKNKKDRAMIPIFLISVILSFVMFALYTELIEKIIAPQNWLFYQINPYFEIVMVACTVWTVIILLQSVLKLFKKENIDKKGLIFVLVSSIIIVYSCLTNITFVTKDKIICYSPFDIDGKQYNYSDVSKVEAKFNKKGDFEYIINIKEKKLMFTVTTPNSEIERYEDSYLELEEFDEKLMDLNITKKSDETNSEKCDLDQVYVERFLRIIRNK